MMSGWPGNGETDCVVSLRQLLYEGPDSPGCGQGRFPRRVVDEGVHVEGTTAELTELLDHFDVGGVVDEGELTALDPWRDDFLDVETRPLYPFENGGDTVAALWMARSGVMTPGRWVARHYSLHVLTLAQVASLLRVEGSWPGPITLGVGWYRARARPWNESITDPMVRLDRGGSDFLGAVTSHLHQLGADSVYSPALYPGSTDIWRRSGFDHHVSLDIMERPLGGVLEVDAAIPVRVQSPPDWDRILDVDGEAFDGFWRMSRLGLVEAYRTNRTTSLLVVAGDHGLSGYAIVGVQWATVYLHRIAVRPEEAGLGLGAALLASAINWGTRSGGNGMVLNVRPENLRAKRLYERMGFAHTATALTVLRHEAP